MKKMNFEELCQITKSNLVILIDKDGKIIESYNDDDYNKTQEFSAVTMVINNMLDNFFKEVLSINPLKEIIIKTEKHHVYITKLDSSHVLCFLSDKAINAGLISLSLKKK